MKRGELYEPTGGAFIGWEDESYYLLNCDSALKAVKRLCDEEGTRFTITLRGLMRALAEEDLIDTFGNQNTFPIRIGDKSKRVMWLRKSKSDKICY